MPNQGSRLYDYDAEEAYLKLIQLIGNFILFKDKSLSHPYVSGKLKRVEKLQMIGTDTYLININLGPPLMRFKDKPTHDQIRTIVKCYENLSEKEKENMMAREDIFVLREIPYIEEKLKKTPRWKFRERNKLRKKLLNLVFKNRKLITEPLKEESEEEQPKILISYAPEISKKIRFKESIDTLEVI